MQIPTFSLSHPQLLTIGIRSYFLIDLPRVYKQALHWITQRSQDNGLF